MGEEYKRLYKIPNDNQPSGLNVQSKILKYPATLRRGFFNKVKRGSPDFRFRNIPAGPRGG
jgi:hypothetical protein